MVGEMRPRVGQVLGRCGNRILRFSGASRDCKVSYPSGHERFHRSRLVAGAEAVLEHHEERQRADGD